MRKLKKVFLSVISFTLIGCSLQDSHDISDSWIECTRINKYPDTYSKYEFVNSFSAIKVYEYKNSDNEYIYANKAYVSDEGSYLPIIVSDAKDYSYYECVRFIGYLERADNYYININEKKIHHEIVFTECDKPFDGMDEYDSANNKEAYECAKKGYYIARDPGLGEPDPLIKKNKDDGELIKHEYIDYKDLYIILFYPKYL